MNKEEIIGELAEHIGVMGEMLTGKADTIRDIAEAITDSYKNKGKLILFGNGGSAADAQHIAAELAGRYKMEREGLPAIALTTNASIITAIGNDYGYERIFEKQVESMATEKDVVIGISTSGNTENVLKGLLKAKEKGAKTIGWTGGTGGKLKEVVDILLNIPTTQTPRIQEAHIVAGHIICGLVEKEIFGNKA